VVDVEDADVGFDVHEQHEKVVCVEDAVGRVVVEVDVDFEFATDLKDAFVGVNIETVVDVEDAAVGVDVQVRAVHARVDVSGLGGSVFDCV